MRVRAFQDPNGGMQGIDFNASGGIAGHRNERPPLFENGLDGWLLELTSCPWLAHAGLNPAPRTAKLPLYTPEERRRRDASPWTVVQAILAPLQFLIFAVSLALVIRFLITGDGYQAATLSILLKTVALITIMVTGSIWEKEVFGKWLFARAFFWEDVFSFLVIGLQTAYVACLLGGWGSTREQMMIAIAAYAAYVINAGQFLLKLRAARLEAAPVKKRARLAS